MLRGYAATFSGDLDAGEQLLSEALALSRDAGTAGLPARILNARAQAALFRGDLDRATALLREGEEALRTVGDAFALAVNLNIQATVAQLRDDGALTSSAVRAPSASAERSKRPTLSVARSTTSTTSTTSSRSSRSSRSKGLGSTAKNSASLAL